MEGNFMKQNGLIGRLISSLNKNSFHRFIYEMWMDNNVNSDEEFIKITKKKRLGEGILEQHWFKREYPKGPRIAQGFDLIIPFEQPIELLQSKSDFKLLFDKENSVLQRFHGAIKRKTNSWYWPQDGNFVKSNISFVSNIYGIERKLYFKKILPKLNRLIKPYNLFSEALIGTCDSFLDMVPDKTEAILKRLFFKDFTELSLKWQDDKISIQQHISEEYLRSGILSQQSLPYDTVITFPTINSIEVYKEFEHILNKHYNEIELEKFINKHYKLIFGNKYEQIETQLWLKFPEFDINNKNRKLDIFLRNAVERDWELIELKAAGKITSTYRNVPTLSSRITGAISQLKNYERILQQDSVKKKMSQQGIEYYEPQLRLVIGGNPNISIEQWRRIKTENEKGLKITTLDELLGEMKFRYKDFETFYK